MKFFYTVLCDNCGAKYFMFEKDAPKERTLHAVCRTCYMPMEVKNPWFKDDV